MKDRHKTDACSLVDADEKGEAKMRREQQKMVLCKLAAAWVVAAGASIAWAWFGAWPVHGQAHKSMLVMRDAEKKDKPVVIAMTLPPVDLDEQGKLRNALYMRLMLRSSTVGEPVMVGHCKAAQDGCEQRISRYAAWFMQAARAHAVDPWLLAAMAVRESGLNPNVVGAVGEFGVMQLHPKSPWGRVAKKRCQKAASCTEVVIDVAAELVARYMRLCSTETKALGAYNSGACLDNGYAKRVLREREQLKKIGGV